MSALFLALTLVDPIPVLESKDFSAELQRAAVTATVRISNAGSSGSGVIIARERVFVYVLTAHHVVARDGGVEIYTFSADSYPRPEKTYKGEVVARSREKDLALVRLVTDDKPPGIVSIDPAKAAPAKGFPGLAVGCAVGGAPTCRLEQVKASKQIKRPGAKDTVLAWEVAEAPREGRSGGPLLDARGQLQGVCSGIGDGRGYFCHRNEILHFLKLNGFDYLYAEERGK
jgi:S1-C subfamily serine protease